MRRVLVLGSGGAGKSTLAARLAECTGLPLIHLDAIYWSPGWVEAPKDEWRKTIERVVTSEAWIIDGNYSGTMEMRLAAADTVIFIDRSRLLCLWRILLRRIQYQQRPRPNMSPGCPERLNWEFICWIWNYTSREKPALIQRLAMLRADQRLVTLQSDRDLDDFVASVTVQRT
jgi:adenylate kinase family enzyme